MGTDKFRCTGCICNLYLRYALGVKWERVCVCNVPMKDVKLVLAHRVHHPLQVLNWYKVSCRVNHEPTVWKDGLIVDDGLRHNLQTVVYIVVRDELAQRFQTVSHSVIRCSINFNMKPLTLALKSASIQSGVNPYCPLSCSSLDLL